MPPGELEKLRERAGYRREDAAQRIFRSSEPVYVRRLQEFETGAARPTLRVLRSLLAAYHVAPVDQEEYFRSYRVAMRLKQRANEKGLTLKHVADKVGVDRTNLSKFFNGSRLVRRPRVLLDIAAALEMDEDEKQTLLQEAGFESFHLGLEGLYYGDLAVMLLDELRRGIGPDRHPATEVVERPKALAEVDFEGQVEIVAAASALVLANLPGSGPSTTIKISAADESFTLDPSVHPLARALRIALEQGVSLQLLLPLGAEPEKIVKTIVGCLQYLGQKGGFEVRWFDPAETAPPLSLMILPDDSVLLFLPGAAPGQAERAALIRPPVSSFVCHFETRFAAACPLLKLYDSTLPGTDDLLWGLTKAEEDSEAVLVVKRHLATHTIPEDLWELEEARLRRHGSADGALVKANDPLKYELYSIGRENRHDLDDVIQRLKAANSARLEGHRRVLERGTVREIYLKEYLEDMLRYPSGIYPPEARIAIIDHLLGWLKRYPRYHIGLATQGDLFESPLFGVHNSETVFLSVWRRQGGAQYLEARQPGLARVFQQYFLQLWSDLPSSDKTDEAGENEKDGVVAWLENLKRRIALPEDTRG